jgi:hypothetical protein
MLTHLAEDTTIPELIIPSPWDDGSLQNDPVMDDFLGGIDNQDEEDDVEVETPDPTTVPVYNILIIRCRYITNILVG